MLITGSKCLLTGEGQTLIAKHLYFYIPLPRPLHRATTKHNRINQLRMHFFTRQSILLLALLSSLTATAQNTYHVTVDGVDDPNRDGLTEATAWASLSYACDRVPGNFDVNDTIQLGPGNFTATETATPEPGTVIQGAGKDETTLWSSRDWVMVNRPLEPTYQDYLISFEKFPLGYQGRRTEQFTIRNMRMRSSRENITHGAILLRGVNDVLIENLHVEDFNWSAVHMIAVGRAEIRNCYFKNTNRAEDTRFMGQVYGRVLRDSKIHHNTFRNTVPGERQWGVGYKGRNHVNVDINDNDFRTGDGFDIEIPFEQEWGVRIYNNEFNKTVSVPKGGANGDPASRGFTYSIWIHHNHFTNGYDIEGPRGYMEVSYNFFDVQGDNGRCISTFGGNLETEPQYIHHNVARNVDRSFMWANAVQNNVEFTHNTIFYRNAGDRSDRMIGIRESSTGWVVKNNIFVADKDDPRLIGGAVGQGSTEFEGNLVVNAADVELPEGNFYDEQAGLQWSGPRPAPYFAPRNGHSFVVDRGVDVGLPFEGNAPDIGAYEFDGFGLPIELTAFHGRTTRHSANIWWRVANPRDFAGFELVELGGEGVVRTSDFTEGRLRYSENIPWISPVTQRQFQLRLLAEDGSVTTSDMLTLTRESAPLTVYPNPATVQVSFTADWAGRYRVYSDTHGQVGHGGIQAGDNTVDVSRLQPGNYYLMIFDQAGNFATAQFAKVAE